MSTLKVNALQDTSGNNLDRIGQIVTASTSSTLSTSSGSFVDSGLTANITPQFTSSKILILIDAPYHILRSSGTTWVFNIKILRGSTAVFTGGAAEGDYQSGIGGTSSSNRACGMISKMIVDSPSSTSTLTYKLQVESGQNLVINDSTTSHISLLEILQ